MQFEQPKKWQTRILGDFCEYETERGGEQKTDQGLWELNNAEWTDGSLKGLVRNCQVRKDGDEMRRYR